MPNGIRMVKLLPLLQRKTIETTRSDGFEKVRSSEHITLKKKAGGSSDNMVSAPEGSSSSFSLKS
jgi:hypothetical protein